MYVQYRRRIQQAKGLSRGRTSLNARDVPISILQISTLVQFEIAVLSCCWPRCSQGLSSNLLYLDLIAIFCDRRKCFKSFAVFERHALLNSISVSIPNPPSSWRARLKAFDERSNQYEFLHPHLRFVPVFHSRSPASARTSPDCFAFRAA